jgi:hypothetical protein
LRVAYAGLQSEVSREEIEEFALSWTLPPGHSRMSDQMFRRFVSSSLRRILFGISDLGIFTERDNKITLTAWGDLLVNTWLGFWLDEPEDEEY